MLIFGQSYKNFEFGELQIESLSICELNTDTDKDGFKIVFQHFLDLSKGKPWYLNNKADVKGDKLLQPW
jgi:hypothetical protein